MAFDAKGQMYVGTKQPDTLTDSVLIMLDENGDGLADRTKVFATGFNHIQALAWHGRDLWVANAPKLTVVRDLNDNDLSDMQVQAFKDLGDLQSICWAPDGRLHLSTSDVMRCDDMGKNLEVVASGLKPPVGLGFDSTFNWLAMDDELAQGTRIVTPFAGANFALAAEHSLLSPSVFLGKATGMVFADSPVFPNDFRGMWLVNDRQRHTTYAFRHRPQGDDWQPFVTGKDAIYHPLDMAFGPDGALYVLSSNPADSRVIRLMPHGAAPLTWQSEKRSIKLDQWTMDELTEDLDAVIPAARIDAADELAKRGESAKVPLLALLEHADLSETKQTWAIWTLGRTAKEDAEVDAWFAEQPRPAHVLNLRLQSLRILAYRHAQSGLNADLPPVVAECLNDADPRLRFEAVQAMRAAQQTQSVKALIERAATEQDGSVRRALCLAFHDLIDKESLMVLLRDPRPGVRAAAFLTLWPDRQDH